MRSPSGEPTGAVYGVVAMLRRLRADGKLNGGADHGAVVFDAPGKTFRDDWYPEYKANRAKMPEDLAAQIPVIHDIVRAMGWPLLMLTGIEADDVIGTLAHHALAHRMKTVIATGDKDLAQLVDHHTVLVNTMTAQGGPPERLDREGVIAKFGVPPERIVDWLTLVGDAVDNVPGVPKVGPKTAVKWLTQYGSLDAVIAHAADIGGVVGQNLRDSLEWLPTARKLVTVLTDCDLSAHMGSVGESLPLRPEDPQALLGLFRRCGFRTWLREVEDALGLSPTVARAVTSPVATEASPGAEEAATPAPGLAGEPVYEMVADDAALSRWLDRLAGAPLVSIDTETTSLDPMSARIVGISLAIEPGEGCYIPLAHAYAGVPDQLGLDAVLERLRPWLEDERAPKVGQNLKYDAHVFENHGIVLRGIAHDTLLQSYVIEAHRNHDMDSLALRHLNRRTITYDEVTGKGASRIGFEQVALDRATRYAAEDAEVTMHLHRTLYPKLQADERLHALYRDIEMPAMKVLQRMERAGVLVDAAQLQAQSEALGQKLMTLERQVHEAAGQPFNLGSPKQLGEILFERQGLPVVKKTATGAPSTDEEVLAKLAEDYPLPKLLLEWRGLSKLKSTYTDKLPRSVNPATGRVHTQFSQAVAVTGRLASSEPNLQNIPIRTAEGRRIREAFVAPPGSCLVSADYSQIELRIMAHLSDDPGLLDAFTRGLDVHRATAAEIFSVAPEAVSAEQRRYAKVINFGLIYGMSAFGLASNLGIERDAAKLYIDRYFARYPGVRRYMDETRQRAHEQGFVETVFGRRLWLPEINSSNGQRRQGAERAAINAPMQGTAADLIKLAMIAVDDWIRADAVPARLVLQVHDELVLEVAEGSLEPVRARLRELMTSVARLKVPLEVEIGAGPNWEQAH